jgi:hypothetical protein
MLEIAENVFKIIADKLIELKYSVRKVFSKKIVVLDEFEGEPNVEIISGENFLECLETQMGITYLSELEIACLLRVLSKPELKHAIVLNELQMVLLNFGLGEEGDNDAPTKDEVQEKKKK